MSLKVVGRIIARGENIAGLFIPMGDSKLKGIYEIRECMGELMIKRIGDPAMPDARFTGLDLEGLHCERATAGMTTEELDGVDPETWRRVC